MNFEHTQKTKDLISLVSNFIENKIKPREQQYADEMSSFRNQEINGRFLKF